MKFSTASSSNGGIDAEIYDSNKLVQHTSRSESSLGRYALVKQLSKHRPLLNQVWFDGRAVEAFLKLSAMHCQW